MGMVLGCDVCKGWVDVQGSNGEGPWRVPNSKAALESWVRKLPAGCVVGMEATGIWHELLAALACAAGHTVFVINPRWIHRYAASVGQRGKCDRLDARVIARFVSAEQKHLHAYQPPSAEQLKLRQLLQQRSGLTKLKIATQQSLGAMGEPVLRELTALLRQVDRQIRDLVRGNADWLALTKRLTTIPGVGPVVAAHLVHVLTRFNFRTGEAFVAHTGTDPRPNDSGQKHGRRRLTHHGDAALRKMLFLAAMTTRRQKDWKAVYEMQRQKGLSSTAALIVLARKLARVAFHVFKTGDSYTPDRAGLPSRA